MNAFLTVRVDIKGITTMNAPGEEITAILFKGTIEGQEFNGQILDAGSDVIHTFENGEYKQFARYMAKGIDSAGEECLLYIENTAGSGSELCKPVLRTDSKALAYINTTDFSGRVFALPDELYIEIYRN